MSEYFVTPQDPEGFSIAVTPPQFRQIDFSALEFETLNRAVIEYIRTYHRDKFNDYVASNGFMMLTELLCYIGAGISQRSDILVNSSFLPTSSDMEAVSNHLALIGQQIMRQTPATTQISCTVGSPVATDIRIPAGYQFNFTGPDGNPMIYEVFSAPYDWTSDILIPSNKRGVIAWGIEGSFATPVIQTAVGGSDQTVIIESDTILEEPIIVEVDGERWTMVDALENYGGGDRVFSVNFNEESAIVRFGDDVNGKAPIGGQNVQINYREGGGVRGRIGAGVISRTVSFSPEPPATAAVPVTMRNIVPSNGGFDRETIEESKKRAPRTWSTHNNIVSGPDYSNIASSFKHPVYGGVLKAVAAVFTSINANIVELSVLGAGAGGNPVEPSLGLRQGLQTYIDELNVATDEVRVVSGSLKSIDLEANIVLFRNTDSASIRNEVDTAISKFFSTSQWDMGQPLYVSSIYDVLMGINGVRYVDIFKPADDVLPAQDVGELTQNTVQYNELIVLGSKDIRIYYEKNN